MSTEEELISDLLGVPNADALFIRRIRNEAASALSRLSAEVQELRAQADACQRQAVVWKMEAMAHKSSLHEAYQVLTDATGEPGNWNGALPFRKFIEADRDEFNVWLRGWIRKRFGKWVTHRTAWDAYRDFDNARRVRARAALKPETVND